MTKPDNNHQAKLKATDGCETKKEAASRPEIGGQAVLEGVMLRDKNNWVVSVRKPDGEIISKFEPVNSLSKRLPIFKWYLIRGIVGIVSMLVIGIRALSFSAQHGSDEEVEIGAKELSFSIILAILLAVGLFVVLPALAVRLGGGFIHNLLALNVVEGIIRIAIFLLYLVAISRLKDIARFFEYHGAEHKVIGTFEAGEEVTPETAAKYSTRHLACGTSFVLIVMVISIIIFTLLGKGSIPWWIGSRLVVIPLVAGISYEIIKFSRRHSSSRWVQLIMKPGLWLQSLTTREPSKDQLEVAIHSLGELLRLEKEAESPQ